MVTVVLPILMSYPISMISIGEFVNINLLIEPSLMYTICKGSQYLNECPIEFKIPIWLIVYGVFGCLMVIFSIVLAEYFLMLVIF